MKSSLVLDEPGFVLGNARILAGWCAAAYTTLPPGTATTITDPVTDTRVDVYEFDDALVAVFQGTKDLGQWLQDFKARLVGGLGSGRVHHGFLEDVDGVIKPLRDRIALSVKPLVITGHSKGGGEAVLAAYLLAGRPGGVHSVYTFGQPRAGDGAFAKAYGAVLGEQTFRVVNQNDIVARVPGLLYGYRHHAQFVLINAAGEIETGPSLVALLISDALGFWAPLRTLSAVKLASWQWVYEVAQVVEVVGKDHFMGQYVAALKGVNPVRMNEN